MSSMPDPEIFSTNWARAWNSRDLEAVLAYFHEDVRFTSPVAKRIGYTSDGIVDSKTLLREYWTMALQRNPNLHFEVTAVYSGVETIVIAYRTQNDEDRLEVLRFRNGLVDEGHGLFTFSSPLSQRPMPDIADQSIVVAHTLPCTPEKVWKVLTDPLTIERWLMENDFEPQVGHRFTFRAQPVYGWNGVTDCEVLEVVPHKLLAYSWSASADQAENGLKTVVTWTLTPAENGTEVQMVQSGFRAADEQGYRAMSAGWPGILEKMEAVAAETR